MQAVSSLMVTGYSMVCCAVPAGAVEGDAGLFVVCGQDDGGDAHGCVSFSVFFDAQMVLCVVDGEQERCPVWGVVVTGFGWDSCGNARAHSPTDQGESVCTG